MTEGCNTPKCGESIRGRPRTGWWRTLQERPGQRPRPVWCCSERCAIRVASSVEPVKADSGYVVSASRQTDIHSRCGQTGLKGFRPPLDWIGVVSREGRIEVGKTWYCSLRCLAASRGEPVPTEEPEPDPVPARLADLNRLAGTSLNVMDATPYRLRVALDRAFSKVMAEVNAQAREDAKRRPSDALLVHEALGLGRTVSYVCGRCRLERHESEFSESQRRDYGQCRICARDSRRIDAPEYGPGRGRAAQREDDEIALEQAAGLG